MQIVGISILISTLIGCVSQETKTALGALGGGVLGGVIGKKLGGDKGAIAGALVGAAIGGTLTHLLTKQDKENIAYVLNQRGNAGEKLSWCSGADTRSISTDDSKDCGTERKVSVIPGEIKTVSTDEGQRECRDFKTEVIDKGELKSVTANTCDEG